MDYAVMQKEILMRLQDGLTALSSRGVDVENLLNLTATAIDYGYYLEDRTMINE